MIDSKKARLRRAVDGGKLLSIRRTIDQIWDDEGVLGCAECKPVQVPWNAGCITIYVNIAR